MKVKTGFVIRLNAFIILILLGGCQSYVEHRGKFLEEKDLTWISFNKTTKAQVLENLGEGTLTLNSSNKWIYVGQRFSKKAFFDPKILETRAFVIEFSNNGLVKNKYRIYPKFRNITIDQTETKITEENITFWEQLVSNYKRMGERSTNKS